MYNQNNIEWIQDQIQLGNMSADEANVEMVRMERVRVIDNSIPRDTRNVLNAAVKQGKLAHKKKEGRKPEVYYHPDFEYLANEERNRAEKKILEALAATLGGRP